MINDDEEPKKHIIVVQTKAFLGCLISDHMCPWDQGMYQTNGARHQYEDRKQTSTFGVYKKGKVARTISSLNDVRTCWACTLILRCMMLCDQNYSHTRQMIVTYKCEDAWSIRRHARRWCIQVLAYALTVWMACSIKMDQRHAMLDCGKNLRTPRHQRLSILKCPSQSSLSWVGRCVELLVFNRVNNRC